jgi:hypothetical protein
MVVAFHALTSLMAVTARLSAFGPREAVAVVFLPGTDPAANLGAIAEAGGRAVRFTAGGWIWVVYPDDEGFFARVRAAGALFSVDPIVVGGCGGEDEANPFSSTSFVALERRR